ncbi:MAG: hypothetical protein OXF06_03850 [Bacteroidetes bacterium]|nr:hypothetical protein [Bacteroidota bacterium]MCY4223952.1 hypothetical protein [Bacteroidota bacterium]
MDKNSHLEFSRISKLLRKSGLDSDEANELTERIMILASSSVLQQIDSLRTEIRSYKESTDIKIDSQKSRITVLTWAIGFATVIVSAVILFRGVG